MSPYVSLHLRLQDEAKMVAHPNPTPTPTPTPTPSPPVTLTQEGGQVSAHRAAAGADHHAPGATHASLTQGRQGREGAGGLTLTLT